MHRRQAERLAGCSSVSAVSCFAVRGRTTPEGISMPWHMPCMGSLVSIPAQTVSISGLAENNFVKKRHIGKIPEVFEVEVC
jgi:hypothetical protein